MSLKVRKSYDRYWHIASGQGFVKRTAVEG